MNLSQQEKQDIQLALENEWTDRLFYYYRTYIKNDAIRSEYDSNIEKWYGLKLELKKLVSAKPEKNEEPLEEPQAKSIKAK
jgi:hypothetical protein